MGKIRNIPPFGFRMEPEVRKQAEELAQSEDRSLNWLLNALVKMALPLWAAKHKRGAEHE